MDWKKLRLKAEDVAAKVLGYIIVYIFVVFTLGVAMKVTQWILSMLGVM